ncbi:MAG TPA: HAD family phosphatase [Candidatus Saccharimonadales bacterium]|nr:HAD family phosphatase [Candidatus Saccharimonadales bacterium]
MIRAVIFDYGWVLRRIRVQRKLVKFAAELRERGVKTAVLSNMVTPVAFVFRHSPELKQFDPVIISCDVGMRKPDPEIYQLMLEKLGLPAEECIFVDNRADNVEAAKKLGMHIIQDHDTAQIIKEIKKLV